MGLVRSLLLGRENGLRARLARGARRVLRRERGAAAPPPPPAEVPLEALPAPEGFVPVLRLDEIGPGEMAEAIVDGVPLAICNVGGEWFAVSDVCPHAGGPIGDGTLDGHTVVCPYHGWSFDIRSGHCFVDATMTLPTYEVRTTERAVCVRRTSLGR